MPVLAQTKPTHSEIQDALNLADIYIRSTVKQLASNQYQEVVNTNQAVIAEYPSIPLKVVHSNGVIIRAGEDTKQGSYASTYLENPSEPSSTVFKYDIGFRYRNTVTGLVYHNVPKLQITINYNYNSTSSSITIKHLAWDNTGQISYTDLYLHGVYIARLNANTVNQTYTLTIDKNSPLLNSFRYIERHGVQLAYQYFSAVGDTTLANKMKQRLIDRGYQAGKDIYAPMFKDGTSYASNFVYESGSNGVYRDCYEEPSMLPSSYQYHSKVCTIGVDTYIVFSRSNDWLVPTLWAIHLLNRGVNPDTPMFDGYQTWSPRQVARHVETKWLADYGIKSPWSDSHASGVRTAAFLVLETLLGYKYGDNTSKQYADKAAYALTKPQVKGSGYITRENEDGSTSTLYRPKYTGAFYTAWNGFNYVAKKSILQQLSDMFSQPDEHPDIKAGNAESTITIAQALRVYDCYAYSYNCTRVP
ncbi:MAG: hypothetical protein RMI32_05570 [Candidatus Nitrosocaldus sp.]|nr:hypothetical protein [Candidatus Nitrosocaldus sp.]